MTMITNDSIGIDISKDFLDAHRLSDGSTGTFPNSARGFRILSAWLGSDMQMNPLADWFNSVFGPLALIFRHTPRFHKQVKIPKNVS
jgi:hypothetical protein